MVATPRRTRKEDAPLQLADNARIVLERRYLARDEQGNIIETPEELFRRVAHNLAQADRLYGATEEEIQATEDRFYEMMTAFQFLPNSPTLVNAGRPLQQLSACFVLPVEDSIEGIFDAVKYTALIHKTGGGTGFSFSRLRPEGDIVGSTHGVASGPVSFMKVFDAGTEAIKQGGFRRGANMGILSVHHPDIEKFIEIKRDMVTLTNFNISVAVTEDYMRAVEQGEDFDLINPHTGQVVGRRNAREIFRRMVENAWRNGDPGMVFIDRMNKTQSNPVPPLGPVEATNPCVTGDTLIYTDAGLRRAADLAAEGRPVRIAVEGASRFAFASPVFHTGRKPVFRLHTSEGYELRLTADHRVLTRRGWVSAQDLRPGDEIRLLSHKGGFGTYGSLALGRLLGWLVGEGTLTSDHTLLAFFGAEKRELAPAVAEMGAGVVSTPAKQRRLYDIRAEEISARDEASIRSARFWRVAAEHGLRPGDKHKVPESVFVGSEEMQRGFLQALFTADGHISGYQEKGVSVRLTSVSKTLLQDVQRLLLNFGIASAISTDRRSEGLRVLPDGEGGQAVYQTDVYHVLVITRDNLDRFAVEIGFLSQAKRSELVSRLSAYRHGPYKERFYAHFLALVPDGEEEVYDLTEPVTSSFVANGLVVHNCGEQPLYPYDSCNLGSINLAKFVKETGEDGSTSSVEDRIDWDELGRVVVDAVHFLDNVIDMNKYPIPQIEHVTKQVRRIGLGVMGWADMLYLLRIPYDSEEAVQLAERVMAFIEEKANAASVELAKVRGVFPQWENSIYNPEGPYARLEYAGPRYRNATRTTIAPTGTISIIADCSSGIEPMFALAFQRQHYLDPKNPLKPYKLTEVNKHFKRVAEEEGFYSEELIQYLAEGGRLRDRPEVPDWVKRVFVTAHDIAPEWHVKMQAAFQRHIDNAVSKTINFAHDATVEDVERAYLLAYRENCKGITIYREGSREWSVLSHVQPEGPSRSVEEAEAQELAEELQAPAVPVKAPRRGGRLYAPWRERLPDERRAITHKFQVGEQEGYVTVGLYDDGRPGEIFVTVAKQGSTISGLMDAVAQLTSVALQYGVPLETLVRQMRNTRFEPAGMTSNPKIPTATSIVDYIFRWLGQKFLPNFNGGNGKGQAGEYAVGGIESAPVATAAERGGATEAEPTGLACPDCGSILFFQEGCLVCRGCGYTKCG